MMLNQIRQYLSGNLPSMIAFCGAGGKTSALLDIAADYRALGLRIVVLTTTRMMIERTPRIDRYVSVESLAEVDCVDPGVLMVAHGVDDMGKIFGFEPEEIDRFFRSGRADIILVEADGANRKPLKAPREGEPRIPGSSQLVIGVVDSEAFEQKAEAGRIHRLPLFLKVTGLEEGSFITPEAVSRLIQSPKGLFRDCPEAAQKVVLVNKVHKDLEAFIMALKSLINEPVVTVDWGIWS